MCPPESVSLVTKVLKGTVLSSMFWPRRIVAVILLRTYFEVRFRVFCKYNNCQYIYTVQTHTRICSLTLWHPLMHLCFPHGSGFSHSSPHETESIWQGMLRRSWDIKNLKKTCNVSLHLARCMVTFCYNTSQSLHDNILLQYTTVPYDTPCIL